MGTTGATGTLDANIPSLCARVHSYSGGIPIAVGFGVSTREHFLAVGAVAEGVVIGSQIVTVLSQAAVGERPEAVRKYCAYITGKDITESTTHDINLGEAAKIAKDEPVDASPTHVITEQDRKNEVGLMDQVEALNAEKPINPEVRLFGTVCLN